MRLGWEKPRCQLNSPFPNLYATVLTLANIADVCVTGAKFSNLLVLRFFSALPSSLGFEETIFCK